MWSNGGSWRSPWRWGWLGVLLLVTLASLQPQTNPFDNLKAALLTLKTQVGELQAKINSLEASLSESKLRGESLTLQINDLQSELLNSQTQINTLLIASSEALKKSEALQALATTLQARLNESRESLRDLKDYLSKLEGERTLTVVAATLTATAAGITIGYLIWGLKR